MHFNPQLFQVSIIQTKLFGPLDWIIKVPLYLVNGIQIYGCDKMCFWNLFVCCCFHCIPVMFVYVYVSFTNKICLIQNQQMDLFWMYYVWGWNVSYLSYITKTRLYSFDTLKPLFYTVKLGFTGLYINFLISAQKHRLWVLGRTASPRRF